MFIDEDAVKAALIAEGIISPQMLQGMEDAALLQEAVDNHYDIVELDKGKKEDRGKFRLERKDIRGGTNLPQTVDAILMAAQAERTGEPVVTPALSTPHSQALRMAGERILAPAGASVLAGVGLRGGAVKELDGAERLERSLDRIDEMDRNRDATSGARLDGVGLDGGHKHSHHDNPELSTARENMQMENKYVNRIKGKESGEAAFSRYHNSLLKRLKNGSLSPLDLANAYQYDAPVVAIEADKIDNINIKTPSRRMARL